MDGNLRHSTECGQRVLAFNLGCLINEKKLMNTLKALVKEIVLEIFYN